MHQRQIGQPQKAKLGGKDLRENELKIFSTNRFTFPPERGISKENLSSLPRIKAEYIKKRKTRDTILSHPIVRFQQLSIYSLILSKPRKNLKAVPTSMAKKTDLFQITFVETKRKNTYYDLEMFEFQSYNDCST